ncbi:O-fucosyltransferase family protein [Peribacillus frigoritolerans]|uniref:O-fucosyltransferase family protein n=1 Tax=Peribacillus frigoritolerans TaxID=450367 RepID=UPI002B255869|nr:O-fucosyltransferase family protein [Peribacillus frigoritolerans]MEB2628199.1 O-fucosyltransferase family protein [Peribacillus frigoritolerans]
MVEKNRFLLIKSWSCGFWSAMEHVSGALLMAELTGRIPVVFWGADSLYASEAPLIKDAFTMYYQPISQYTIDDVEKENFMYYPFRWNKSNLRFPGEVHLTDLDNVPDLFSRPENVLVSSIHTGIHYFQHLIKENHPVYGLDFHDKHRYIFRKYFKLQPYLSDEIEKFYNENMKDKHPVLGVHVRGNDKIVERPHLNQLNAAYFSEIDKYLEINPSASIFLLTDSESILEKYKVLYGNKVIHTDSIRTESESVYESVHVGLPHCSKRQKGIDIVKDTYLATKCDHFIGASYSNVSLAIYRLKEWPKGTITLMPE